MAQVVILCVRRYFFQVILMSAEKKKELREVSEIAGAFLEGEEREV